MVSVTLGEQGYVPESWRYAWMRQLISSADIKMGAEAIGRREGGFSDEL